METSPGLIRAMLRVWCVVDALGIRYCLIGGLAVSMLATPRATGDIDVAVIINASQRSKLLSELRRYFVIVRNKPLMKLRRATIWRLILKDKGHPDELVIVDFVLANKNVSAEAVASPVVVEIDGTPVRVARPERLLAIKEYSGRPQDIADAEVLREVMQRKVRRWEGSKGTEIRVRK